VIYGYGRASRFSKAHVLPENGIRALCNFVPKSRMWMVDLIRPACDCARCFCKKCHQREQHAVNAERDAGAYP
jgi:hypothetical protein